MTVRSVFGWKSFVNLIAYISIVCIGLALLIGKIGAGSLSQSFEIGRAHV